VVRVHDQTAAIAPVGVQPKNDLLKRQRHVPTAFSCTCRQRSESVTRYAARPDLRAQACPTEPAADNVDLR
jgi:hypothetical protein